MTPQDLADEFTALTDEMAELRERNRLKRAILDRKHAEQVKKMRDEERDLSARRAQVALKMTQTGRNLGDLGAMAGVSGPFICQLARKAREANNARTTEEADHGHRDGE